MFAEDLPESSNNPLNSADFNPTGDTSDLLTPSLVNESYSGVGSSANFADLSDFATENYDLDESKYAAVAVENDPLLGDNFAVNLAANDLSDASLSIDQNLAATAGETFSVAINLENGAGVQAADILLNFDTDLLDVNEVSVGSLNPNWSVFENINEENGELRLSLFTTQPLINGTGSIVEIEFQVAEDAVLNNISTLDLVSAALNESFIPTLTDGSFEVIPASFRVVDFATNPSGFEIKFNRELDLSQLNLYDGQDLSDDLPDLTLVGNKTGAVNGSLVYDADRKTITFVKTGDILAPDTYTVTLDSRIDGFIDLEGELLDGDRDNLPGGDYTQTFTIDKNKARILSLPDFTRGDRQFVEVPNGSLGLPISIDNGKKVTSIDLELSYNPDFLDITGASLAADVPADWDIEINLDTPGQVQLSLSGTKALSGKDLELLFLEAIVPTFAPDLASQVISISSVTLNEGKIDAVGDSAIHQVGYLGDATGNGAYTSLDASFIARVAARLDTGFDAYPLTDPVVIGDVTGDGTISSMDAAIVAREAIAIRQPEIPEIVNQDWNASFINLTPETDDDYRNYDFSNPAATAVYRQSKPDSISLNLDLGYDAPHPNVDPEHFAMEAWTSNYFDANKVYKVTINSDNGTRFFLRNPDTDEIINLGADWRTRNLAFPTTTHYFNVEESGFYDFTFQFYEGGVIAVVDIELTEAPDTVSVPDGLTIPFNFNDYGPILSYGINEKQDINPTLVNIEDHGSTLHLAGNTWKAIELPYTITPDTVLAFDFKTDSPGEAHSIGIDVDLQNDPNDPDNFQQYFSLYGTQTEALYNTEQIAFHDYADMVNGSVFIGEYKHYEIPIGRFFSGETGEINYLTFINDHDVDNPTAESFFSNVKLYEDKSLPSLDFKDYQIKSYGINGPQDTQPIIAQVEDNGDTLHLKGNTWKAIDFPYTVTGNTILEFDFKSTVEGEGHGIGFDDDLVNTEERNFALYGNDISSQFLIKDFLDYEDTIGEWKHYRIPVGEFYTGDMNHLFFINDEDVANPTAESFFANLRVYEDSNLHIPAGNWKAEYFPNKELYGHPLYVQNLGSTNQFSRNWGNGSPDDVIPVDNFSARISSRRDLSDQLYQVHTQADDGVRVKVGDTTVVNKWQPQPFLHNTGYINTDDRVYPVTIDYFENGGLAALSFGLNEPNIPGEPVNTNNEWYSVLFHWDDSQGNQPPVDSFIDYANGIATLNLGSNTRSDGKKGIVFDYEYGAVRGEGHRLPDDDFAIVAHTQADFDGSEYNFRVRGDDGFYLRAKKTNTNEWHDITPTDNWQQVYGSHQEYKATLPAGRYDVHFYYYEHGGDAEFDLSWEKVATGGGGGGGEGTPLLTVQGSQYFQERPDFYMQAGNGYAKYGYGSSLLGTNNFGQEGNCTWYAYGRLKELGYTPDDIMYGYPNANQWGNVLRNGARILGNNETPQPGDVAQWLSGSAGHVAVVEKVENGFIYLSESHWGSDFDGDLDGDGLTLGDGTLHRIVKYSVGTPKQYIRLVKH
ncbi:cohesin domain-containing protein [Oscillatoria salina]|uniref:cohesin domain-containing protein n=1 Tax=Oscillatoria salina TaxID=331517 RepID=UPI001CCBB7BC|nr:cohesin domain-containing protein [Oscillatoria salina]MBZ8180005.1 CHAP domain-containing protein [Oscillatoria salina IIICB1]